MGSHSQALLRSLQGRVRTRQLQKARPKGTVSAKPRRPESKALRPEDKSSSKEVSRKKKWQVCRKRGKKKQEEDDNLAEADGVQVEVIPAILASLSRGFLTGRGSYQSSDVCVLAPTGHGKTLAIVIPEVQVRDRKEAQALCPFWTESSAMSGRWWSCPQRTGPVGSSAWMPGAGIGVAGAKCVIICDVPPFI